MGLGCILLPLLLTNKLVAGFHFHFRMTAHIEVDEQFDHYLERLGSTLVWLSWLSVGYKQEERYSTVQNMHYSVAALALEMAVLALELAV